VVAAEQLQSEALKMATELAEGPTIAHATTKQCLHREWEMSVDEAIDFEAEAQARCMETADFERAYQAFAAKRTPTFEGN
jgi:enoyl-CoA hydratase/carnithine racemase